MRRVATKPAFFICLAAFLFAIFPLTDTDIWWHLACAREWVTTWTPVREPVVNVHEYFQQIVGLVYGFGGAPLLVCFKALLWSVVFFLFLNKNCRKYSRGVVLSIILLFVFRYQLEVRPVLFSLLFLGLYWNILPKIFDGEKSSKKKICFGILILFAQWIWCKCQGLYILGSLFASAVLFVELWSAHVNGKCIPSRRMFASVGFVGLLFLMPFLHGEGLLLFAYPFELLNRLLGLAPSAAIFASEIAENRSPVTLLLNGENPLTSLLMVAVSIYALIVSLWSLVRNFRNHQALPAMMILQVTLATAAALSLLAERNFVLLLPVFVNALCCTNILPGNVRATTDGSATSVKIATGFASPTSAKSTGVFKIVAFVLLAFILGLWCRSLQAYDRTMISSQRVPVDAAEWMKDYPHKGRLFNDDRAGGYLAFVNPQDSIYIDGRFMLKTVDFFKQYLRFAESPAEFVSYADSLGIDRAVFPLQYYARWNTLLKALSQEPSWHLVYHDDYFAVFDK